MDILKKIGEKIARLINVKSILTIVMTLFLGILLFYDKEINESILSLFCASYGAIIGYFFSNEKDEINIVGGKIEEKKSNEENTVEDRGGKN